MRILRIFQLFVFFTFFTITLLHSQYNEVILDNAGKTLFILPSYTNSKPIKFIILNPTKEFSKRYKLNYRFVNNLCDPFLLAENDSCAEMTPSKGLEFIIPKSPTNYLVYNLLIQINEVLENSELQRKQLELEMVVKKNGELKTKISNLDQSKDVENLNKVKKEKEKIKIELLADDVNIKQNKITMEKTIKRIEDIEKEIGIYKSLNQEASVKEISRLVKESNQLKNELAILGAKIKEIEINISAKIDNELNEIEKKINKLNKEIAENEYSKDLKIQTQKQNEYEDSLDNNSKPKYSVKKIGGIIIGENRKSVYYDIVIGRDSSKAISLKRIGIFPKFTEDDLISIMIINSTKKIHSNPFNLTYSVDKGAVVNTTSLRPTFEYKIQGGTDQDKYTDIDSAYTDILLLSGQKFYGNEILKVTISTYIENVTSDKISITENEGEKKQTINIIKEKSLINLINEEEFPQIRALYRYNLTPGVILSTLNDSQFVKVKIGNNPDKDTESIYRIDEIQDKNKIIPIIAFSFYFKKVDIQEPLAFQEMIIPSPTIGFGLKNPDPTKNIFLGFSNEFLYRNMQLFWGFQYGEVTKLQTRNVYDEEKDSSAPTTYKKHELKFCIGLKFNINFITNIIN